MHLDSIWQFYIYFKRKFSYFVFFFYCSLTLLLSFSGLNWCYSKFLLFLLCVFVLFFVSYCCCWNKLAFCCILIVLKLKTTGKCQNNCLNLLFWFSVCDESYFLDNWILPCRNLVEGCSKLILNTHFYY